MFKVEITTTPSSRANWTLPKAWLIASDEDGNSMVVALMPNGAVVGEDSYPVGDNTDQEYIDLRAACVAALAA